MYDELTKLLRNRRICVQYGGDLEQVFPLMCAAADAIEELSAEVDALKHDIERYVQINAELNEPPKEET